MSSRPWFNFGLKVWVAEWTSGGATGSKNVSIGIYSAKSLLGGTLLCGTGFGIDQLELTPFLPNGGRLFNLSTMLHETLFKKSEFIKVFKDYFCCWSLQKFSFLFGRRFGCRWILLENLFYWNLFFLLNHSDQRLGIN